MYKHHTQCRACRGNYLVEAFDLGVQPLANNFTTADEAKAGHAPLKLMFCPDCTLTQLSVVVRPEILYSNYCYVTSASHTMHDHFQSLWREIKSEGNADRVMEVGSNDGRFLRFCKDQGATDIVGIDPAANLRPVSASRETFMTGLFTPGLAEAGKRMLGRTDVIVARHVFGHIHNWDEFMAGLDAAAYADTLVVIEVPYVQDMLDGLEFDTIYHEHLSYISVRAVEALLHRSNFKLVKIVRFPIHGGAIALMLRRKSHPSPIHSSVAQYLRQEQSLTLKAWNDFGHDCGMKIDSLRSTVHGRVSVCGFGASAKSTVWLNACGFTRKHIAFVCDCTPQKQGRQSPGTDIPIVPESALLVEKPEAAVLFAWNFRDEIIRNNQAYLDQGGQFLIPGIKTEVISR